MNVDPAAQLRLLDLQGADTALAQQRHKRASLPELAKIASLIERSEAVHNQQIDLKTALHDVAADQRRLENEVETVRTRAARDNDRLSGGGLPAKELEGLQHEITSLSRRQSSLEDELLEVMEQREDADLRIAALDSELEAILAEQLELEAARDRAFAEIDAASTERREQRAEIVDGLPADLLALYEKVAAASGGVGAAALKHRRCEGCHLELAGNELTTVRAAPSDLVLRCDNCRRILIRTAESGL